MKNKNAEMFLNLYFSFRIGIKETDHLFGLQSKAILKVVESFAHLIQCLPGNH